MQNQKIAVQTYISHDMKFRIAFFSYLDKVKMNKYKSHNNNKITKYLLQGMFVHDHAGLFS